MEQSGIFNVLDYAISPDNAPGTNTTNLQNLVNSLLSSTGPTGGNGGTISFPMVEVGEQSTYSFAGTITISAGPASILFIGASSGSGTSSPANPTPLLLQTEASDLFYIDNNPGGSADIAGIVFQDLTIEYAEGLTSGAAIHMDGPSGGGPNNVRIFRVEFLNCPQAVWFESSLFCTMLQCNVYNAVNEGVPVTIGNSGSLKQGLETRITDCLFLFSGTPSAASVALQIYGCDQLRVVNTKLQGWGQGILITPGVGAVSGSASNLYFGNVKCYPESVAEATAAAVLIQTGNGKSVAQVLFHGCDFTPPATAGPYTGAGIYINPGSGTVVDQIRFVDCYSCIWLGPGMQIAGGSNIEILGGYYSCNGQAEDLPSPYSASGIAITGAATGIRITGAACNNSVYAYNAQQPGTQAYGVYVSAGASSVRIHSCDLTGNSDNGVLVTGATAAPSDVFIKHCDFTGLSAPAQVVTPVTNLQITDCPGYNDQGTPVSSTAPPSGVSFNGSYAGTGFTPYYGPVMCYCASNATATIETIKLNGKTSPLEGGAFMVGPGNVAEAKITYVFTTAGPSFLMIGY